MESNFEESPNSAQPQHAASSPRMFVLTAIVCTLIVYAPFVSVNAAEPSTVDTDQSDVPAWVFRMNAVAQLTPASDDNLRPLHVPNSKKTLTEAALNDLGICGR